MERRHCCAGRDAASAGAEEHEEGDDATLEEASMTTVAKTRGRGERAAGGATPGAARKPEKKVSEGVIVGRVQRWLGESEAGGSSSAGERSAGGAAGEAVVGGSRRQRGGSRGEGGGRGGG